MAHSSQDPCPRDPQEVALRVLVPAEPHDPALAERLRALKQRRWLECSVTDRPLGILVEELGRGLNTRFVISSSTAAQPVSLECRGARTTMDALVQLTESVGLHALIDGRGHPRILSEAEFERLPPASKARLGVPALRPPYFPQLEMRMVAVPEKGRLEVDLAHEKQRLRRWLEKDGNRDRVLADTRHLARFHGLEAARGGRGSTAIRWFPHWVTSPDGERFAFSYTNLAGSSGAKEATFPLFEATRHRAGPRHKDDRLLEFIAVNMSERGFHTLDLDRRSLRRARSAVPGEDVLEYRFKKQQAKNFSDLSGRAIGRAMALILDGDLLSAPIFVARIPGVLQLSGLRGDQIDKFLRALDK